MTIETLTKLMKISLLNISPDLQEKYLEHLSFLDKIIKDLWEVNTTDVEPLYNVSEEFNILRDDIPTENIDHNKALSCSNSSFKNDYFFTIKK